MVSADIETQKVVDSANADIQELSEKVSFDDDAFTSVKVPLSRQQFALVYTGLLLATLLAALDQTIVATALKTIVEELGEQELVSWIGSAYLLTAAPLGTLYGKFADIFGRKWIFVFAVVVFELGSLLCGVATSMKELIIARAIAGIGGGGIFALVVIIISDVVSIRDRGKYQGLFGAVFGLSSVMGPLLGGAFSDHVTWRWCFFINLPLGLITLAIVVVYLKFPPVPGTICEKLKRIDAMGACLLFFAIICFATPLQLGGSIWSWSSPQVISLFSVSAILFALFAYVEAKIASEPILPPSIFINSSVPAIFATSFCLGASFLSGGYFISLFFQVVFGNTATQAGLQSIPLVFGLVIMSICSGLWVSKFGTYRHFFFIGPLVIIAGTVLVASLDSTSTFGTRIAYLFVFGLGLGNLLQIRVIAIQCSVPREMIAIATAVIQTCYILGGAVGEAVTGTILNNVVAVKTSGSEALNSAKDICRLYGYDGDVAEVLQLLETIGIIESRLEANSTLHGIMIQASKDLAAGFNSAFQVSYLCLLAYPIMVLFLAFFIKQYERKPHGSK